MAKVKSIEKKEEYPTLFVEAVGMKGSGWIQDGTENSANPVEISWPTMLGIPNTGFRKVKDADGKWFNEPIRHIKNCNIISVAEQDAKNIKPSPDHSTDKIFLEKGFGMFVRDPENQGTYDFINEVFYNESNPERSKKATALYRVIKLEERNEDEIEDTMAEANAMQVIGKLYEIRGKGNYVYNEQAIDGLCQVMNVVGESYSSKVIALQRLARFNPKKFITTVTKFQQTTLTEVAHALELNVIQFKDNAVVYVEKGKVIVTLGNEKMKREDKVEAFANWLRTSDGHEAYMELQAEIELAKTKQLVN